MNKTRVILSKIARLLMVVSLIYVLSLSAIAAPGNTEIVVPAGMDALTIDIYAEESESFAGIEFLLSISDESALNLHLFVPALPGAIAAPIEKTERANLYSFGFFAGTNRFSGNGNTLVGRIHCSNYIGNQKVTIKIEEMHVNRLDNDNKSVVTVTYPMETYTIQREGLSPEKPNVFYKVVFDLNGGEWAGGGAIEQEVEESSLAHEPAVTRSGYEFLGWDKAFDCVTSDMVVKAVWKANTSGGVSSGGGTTIPSVTIEDQGTALSGAFPFTDVGEGTWYYPNIYYMWEKELMNGMSPTLFGPNGPVQRGMVVTVLYRIEGEPDISELNNPFDDVADSMYYTNAVIWAADKGVVLGYSETSYGPNDNVTREQLAAILFRYQKYKEQVPPNVNGAREFDDAGRISEYAIEPVNTMVRQGIINGRDNNTFDPRGNATRAEYAAMLHRFLLAIAKE